MNRLKPVSAIQGRSNGFAPDPEGHEENRLQWVQSTCEQLGDGYLVFSMWQCLGMGGMMWRDPGSGALYRAKNEEWLSVFHEDDQAVVSLGLADPATNRFPSVRVQDRRDGLFKRARLRLFYPPFDCAQGLFVVVLQLEPPSKAPSSATPSARNPSEGVFAATSAEMLVVDIAQGLVESANPAFLKRNRLDAADVVGRPLEALPILDPEVAKVLRVLVEMGGKVRRRPIVLTSPGANRGKCFSMSAGSTVMRTAMCSISSM